MSEDLIAFTIRIPPAMEKQIAQRAKVARRSRAQQVTCMLEAYLDAAVAPDFKFMTDAAPDPTGT